MKHTDRMELVEEVRELMEHEAREDFQNLTHLRRDFLEIAKPIVQHPEYQKMKTLEHHSASVFAHSVGVAYYSFLIAERLGMDTRSITRGALLHDFFLYEFDDRRISKFVLLDAARHTWAHPRMALVNAEKHFTLNRTERNVIKAHMFPVGLPKSPEAMVVSLVDKTLAVYEYMLNFSKARERSYENRFGLEFGA